MCFSGACVRELFTKVCSLNSNTGHAAAVLRETPAGAWCSSSRRPTSSPPRNGGSWADARIVFSGYGVQSGCRKLEAHHGLEAARGVELQALARMGKTTSMERMHGGGAHRVERRPEDEEGGPV
ncbi:hypothetical protein ABZP36_001931 [Zizania latifolia]